MISKQKTHKLALLKNILVLPVAVLALLLSQETLMAQGTGGDEVITELSTDEGKVNLIQLEGVYHGKNIYVQNPYHPSGVGYSIQSVSINGDRVDQDLNYDSFELDLSHLDDGDQVIIEIVCAAGSLAKILNPEDLER